MNQQILFERARCRRGTILGPDFLLRSGSNSFEGWNPRSGAESGKDTTDDKKDNAA